MAQPGSHVSMDAQTHPLGAPPPLDDAPLAAAPAPRASALPGLAAFAGFVTASAGVALVAAPQVSWPLTKIARQLMAQGLSGGMLFAAGATVFALGLLARSMRRTEEPVSQGDEVASDVAQMSFVLEQVAGEVAWSKTQLAYVSACVESLTARTEELALRPSGADDGSPTGGQQNALFQLAASLDKLGAHFDKLLDDRVASLASQIEGVRVALDGFDPASLPEAVAEAPPVPAEPVPADQGEEMQIVVDLDVEGSLEDEPAMEFFDALDGLEETLSNDSAGADASRSLDLDRLELDTPAPPQPGGSAPLDMKLPGESVRESLEREHGGEPPANPLG